jgi:adenylate kinase family enzyme
VNSPLETLGSRVCIIGPSNSGKSTLANRLGEKMKVDFYHLDQIAHEQGSNWKRRDDKDFVSDHDKIIALNKWIIEGNYSLTMPQRFARATSVIWLDPPLIGFLYRYILRSIKDNPHREGNLHDAKGQFSFNLIKYTFFNYPKNKVKYENLLQAFCGPVIKIRSMRELNVKYKEWDISL